MAYGEGWYPTWHVCFNNNNNNNNNTKKSIRTVFFFSPGSATDMKNATFVGNGYGVRKHQETLEIRY